MEITPRITTISAMAALATIASAGAAFATTIPIVNPNFNQVLESAGSSAYGTLSAGKSTGLGTTTFSDPITYSDGTSSTAGYVPGWSGSGFVTAQATAGNIPAGTYIEGYYFSAHQILTTDVQPNTTYTLTANIGTIFVPTAYYYGDNLDLSYGASVSGTTFTAGTNLAGFNVKGTQTSGSGGYRPAYQSYNQVVFTATTGATASGPLAIELGNYYASGTHGELSAFSGLTLTSAPAPVPEAPTLALLAVGALAVLGLRRKRT